MTPVCTLTGISFQTGGMILPARDRCPCCVDAVVPESHLIVDSSYRMIELAISGHANSCTYPSEAGRPPVVVRDAKILHILRKIATSRSIDSGLRDTLYVSGHSSNASGTSTRLRPNEKDFVVI
jgi:hypothetical protein